MILVDYNVDLEKFCVDLSLDLINVCASKCRSNIIWLIIALILHNFVLKLLLILIMYALLNVDLT